MDVILDKLSLSEFFNNGGVVVMRDGRTAKDYYDVYENEGDTCSGVENIKEAKIGKRSYEYDACKCCFMYMDPRMDKNDPYGIPNCNFTLIDESDSRWEEFKKQRMERGFDDSETWSLDYTIAKFVYPRLKAFANDGEIYSYPGNLSGAKEWSEILEKMLYSFECIINDKTDEDNDRFNEGLDLFRNYFMDLWN